MADTKRTAHDYAWPTTPDGMETYQVACYLPSGHAGKCEWEGEKTPGCAQ